MDSQHLDQSLKNRTFHLFNRPLHPELFTIHAQDRIYQGDYEVQLWVAGRAHVISVFAGGYCMTEVVCNTDQLLPRRGLIERFACRSTKKYQCTWPNGMVYLLNAEVESTSAAVYRHTYRDLKSHAHKRGLFVEFTADSDDDGCVPFSYADYDAGQKELQLFTYHALPECQSIVKTQSLFKLTPKRRRRRVAAD